jgi:sterol desaturase/sphingolipid hydroxylase (fatty acid hydroxylase superfamily)
VAPMTEGQFQVLRGLGFVAAMSLAVVLQRLTPHGRLRGSWRVNGALWLVNLVVLGSVCGACACTVARWAADRHVGLLNTAHAAPWISMATSVGVLDLVSYGWHRANHVIPLLWRFHQVHHSDPTFTASTGVRFHPGELLLSLPLRLTAVVVVGTPVAAVLVFEVMFTIANFLEHGDIDLPGRFELLMACLCITPALHRRHHTKTGPDRDTNFGTVFSVWDRFFGTYAENDSATRIETGLPGFDAPSFTRVLALPLQPIIGQSRRFGAS